MWQMAECQFFTDQYAKAEDTYDEIVKKYANTKYLDRIAQRQFVIAQYWIALDDKHRYYTIVPNLFDRSRPIFDTRGRALKAYDHVRLNDPRGPLADDSIMAQANAHFTRRQWLDADYFYGLLRTEYPDSDFLLQALRRHGGNITKAAEDVGMYRQNFQQKMRELGLTTEDAGR